MGRSGIPRLHPLILGVGGGAVRLPCLHGPLHSPPSQLVAFHPLSHPSVSFLLYQRWGGCQLWGSPQEGKSQRLRARPVYLTPPSPSPFPFPAGLPFEAAGPDVRTGLLELLVLSDPKWWVSSAGAVCSETSASTFIPGSELRVPPRPAGEQRERSNIQILDCRPGTPPSCEFIMTASSHFPQTGENRDCLTAFCVFHIHVHIACSARSPRLQAHSVPMFRKITYHTLLCWVIVSFHWSTVPSGLKASGMTCNGKSCSSGGFNIVLNNLVEAPF